MRKCLDENFYNITVNLDKYKIELIHSFIDVFSMKFDENFSGLEIFTRFLYVKHDIYIQIYR